MNRHYGYLRRRESSRFVKALDPRSISQKEGSPRA